MVCQSQILFIMMAPNSLFVNYLPKFKRNNKIDENKMVDMCVPNLYQC
jgi:hypothetical protein